MIRRCLGWLLTPLYLMVFATTVILWHPLILFAYRLGPRAYHATIACGNGLLLLGLRLMGTRICAEGFGTLPAQRPIIVISNHQSLYDIPLLLWYLRRHHPCFIAKKELGKGIPSASHALRNMGSVLIDRGDPRGSIAKIEGFGIEMLQLARAAVIFPEGTRARDGRMKPFKTQGLRALYRSMPEALIAPVVISGSWHLTQWGLMPVYPGARISIKVLPLIPARDVTIDTIASRVEALIRQNLPAHEAERPIQPSQTTAQS